MLNFVQGIGFQNEEPIVPRVWGGSWLGRVPNIEWHRHTMHERMIEDYFLVEPVYGPTLHWRWYRIQCRLLVSIIEKVCAHDNKFLQKRDVDGLLGFSLHQKITSVLRTLHYRVEHMLWMCITGLVRVLPWNLRRFCIATHAKFEGSYLRQPIRNNMEKQLAINEACGLLGMFASLDCMHTSGKIIIYIAWQGDFGNRDGNQLIILEAIANGRLHVWHVFFGLLGLNNNLNVLDCSSLIQNLSTSAAHDMTFVINSCQYNHYYLFTNGIYPPWSCFVQTIHEPQDEKKVYFAKRQAVRKDIKQCFGVFQARFVIICNSNR